MVLDWITVVGCVLSILSLSLCVYAFAFVEGLRSQKNTIHGNLALSLVLANTLFLTGIDAIRNPELCKAIAVILHFLFLSAFGWKLAEGIHLYKITVADVRNICK